MANRLNVLVGATFEQNVEKKLNTELRALEGKLNELSIKANFDDDFKKIVSAIQNAVSSIDMSIFSNGLSVAENALARIKDEMQDLGKVTEKSNKVVTDLQGNLKSVERTIQGIDGKEVKVKFKRDKENGFDGDLTYTDTTGQKLIAERQKAEKYWLGQSVKANENAAKKNEAAWKKYSNFMMKVNTENRIKQEELNSYISSAVDKGKTSVNELYSKYGNLKDIDGKKFFKKSEFDEYIKSLDKIAKNAENSIENTQALVDVKKELDNLLKNISAKDSSLNKSIQDDKKARVEKEKHNEAVKKSKEAYDKFKNTVKESRDNLEKLKTAFPELDFSEEEKNVRSLEGALLSYTKSINQAGKDTQHFVDLEKKLSSKDKNVVSLNNGLEKRFEQEKKATEKAALEAEKLADKQYKQELKLNSHIEEQKRKAAEDAEKAASVARQKELRAAQASYDKIEKSAEDVFENIASNRNIFDDEDISKADALSAKMREVEKVLDSTTSSTEDFVNAQKRMVGIQAEADEYKQEIKERIVAENKLQKEYIETKNAANEARKIVAKSLDNAKNSLGNNVIHSDELEKLQVELLQVGEILDKDDAKVEELRNALERLDAIKINIDARTSFEEKLNKELERIQNNLDVKSIKLNSKYGDLFNEAELRAFYDITEAINKELRKQKPEWSNVARAIKQADNNASKFEAELAASAKEAKRIQKELDILDSSLGRFIEFYGFGELFRAGKTAVTEMVQAVSTLDASIVELKKVTDETDSTYERFLGNAAKSAKELGVSMSDYIDSVTSFARSGFGFYDSQEIAKTANIMQMVSEDMSAEDASGYLISIIRGFNMEASESIDIVNALNNVDRRSRMETHGQTLSFYRKTSRNGRPIPRTRLKYVMYA